MSIEFPETTDLSQRVSIVACSIKELDVISRAGRTSVNAKSSRVKTEVDSVRARRCLDSPLTLKIPLWITIGVARSFKAASGSSQYASADIPRRILCVACAGTSVGVQGVSTAAGACVRASRVLALLLTVMRSSRTLI